MVSMIKFNNFKIAAISNKNLFYRVLEHYYQIVIILLSFLSIFSN